MLFVLFILFHIDLNILILINIIVVKFGELF